MMYQFKIKHTPGKDNSSADATSRFPVGDPPPEDLQDTMSSICASLSHVAEPTPVEDTDIECSIHLATMMLLSDSPQLRSVTWERIMEAANVDRECRDLSQLITRGFPRSKKDLPDHLKQFWSMREDLYNVDGVPIQDGKILIPTSLRREVLECLHSAHQGVTGMQAHARQRLFWPGLDAAIRLIRAQCQDCNNIARSQSEEPLVEAKTPEFPFQSTSSDLFHHQGHKFLLYVDRFTAWLEIALTPRSDAETVCNKLRQWFTAFGVPSELTSDGGPPFDSNTYLQFLSDWGISRRLSSAYFPQGNGRAELGVKSGKRLLMANIDSTGSLDRDKVSRALMTYRNTPLQDSHLSPAELLFGRKLRDHLPIQPGKYPVLPKWKEIREQRENVIAARNVDRMENSHETRKPLPALNQGDHVMIQDASGRGPPRWTKSGIIMKCLPFRQYEVKVDGSGRQTTRNRIHLRPLKAVPDVRPVTPPMNSIVLPGDEPITHPRSTVISAPQPMFTSTPTRATLENGHNQKKSDQAPEQDSFHSPITHDTTTPNVCNESPTIPYDNTSALLHPNASSGTDASPMTTPQLRRVVRSRLPPSRLSPKLYGKTHT